MFRHRWTGDNEEVMRTLVLVLLVTTAFAAGCGTEDVEEQAREATTALTDTGGAAETAEEALQDVESAIQDALTLDLEEQNNSRISGTVAVTPTSDGDVEVEIELDGSEGGPHPAHIHPGTCENLDPEPQWPLEDVVDGRSKTTVDVSLDDLGLEEYAVNVHESPENADRYVACADLRPS
jgi:hypothetical protein